MPASTAATLRTTFVPAHRIPPDVTGLPPRLAMRRLWALFTVFAVLWLGTLDYRKLIKPDEGRYAEIAREMAVSGDWITPRLNGIKYFEKPPLQYWATAAAYKIFGTHEWTARLWTALTGLAGVWLAWFTVRRLWGSDAAATAAMCLASSLLYFGMGHMNTLDMGLTFFLQLALCGFLLANATAATPDAERRWMLVTWGALALAVLSKGIVALVLTGGTLVVYSVANRDFSPWRRLHLLLGLPVFFAIAAPWFIAVSVVNPEFPHFFFIHEHFERFLTPVHRREQAWWYFLPILLLGLLPWTTLVLRGVWRAWQAELSREFAPARLLLVWAVLTFAFFSVSSSKLPSYILPVLPALAMAGSAQLLRLGTRELRIHLLLLALLAGVALVAAPRVAERFDRETTAAMMQNYAHWLTAAAALFLAATLAALLLTRAARRADAFLALAAGAFAAGNAVVLGHEALAASNSSYYLAREVSPQLQPSTPFYSVQGYDQTLPFYLDRTLTLVDFRDEMDFGLQQEPQLAVDSVDQFKHLWRSQPGAYAVLGESAYNQLAADALPMRIVARDTRRIVVRNPE
ncbi:MAG: glycosyltransferase family 39 protein [Rhodocyclaceae bacterium]|nr:glycosyltransferase family 39 protein [Rhodocyclaceae bacterium]